MANKIYFTVFIWLFCFFNANAQVWPKYYGQQNCREYARKIIETYDNGYLILGEFFNTSYSKRWAWIIKTDINGNILWEKIFENSQSYTNLGSVLQSNDGGYFFCGTVAALNGVNLPVVVKLNACGEKEWCKIFGRNPNTLPYIQDIKETESGDIVLLVNQFGSIPQETIHLFKLNAEGEVIWKKAYATMYNYPNTNTKLGESLLITKNGKYLISGGGYWEQPWNPGGPMPLTSLFIMSDSDGNEEWVLPFGLKDTIIGKTKQTMNITDDVFLGTGFNWPNTDLIEPCYMVFNSAGYELNYTIIKPDSINSLLLEGTFEISQLINTSVFSTGNFALKNGQRETIVDCILNFNMNTMELNPLNNLICFNGRYPYTNTKSFDNKLLSNSSYYRSSTDYDIFLAKLNLNLEYDTAYTIPITYDSLCTSGAPQSGFIYLNDCPIDMDLPGDSNCDAIVSLNDIVSSVAKILGGIPQPFCPQNADANGDGVLNVVDVVETANIIVGRIGRY
ncbi:MAG: hypothetical protein GX128_10620 [Bacteroidales bacterium]|nr:hypothetical protein [Bacteroidales bacterium]